jgi:hypothetical protein
MVSLGSIAQKSGFVSRASSAKREPKDMRTAKEREKETPQPANTQLFAAVSSIVCAQNAESLQFVHDQNILVGDRQII